MDLKLDPQDRTPLYAQLVQHIKQQVAGGQLKPGDRLPTVRALAAQLHVHANTVARAYDQLDRDGVISAQQGRGTFIAARGTHDQVRQQRRATLRTLIDPAILNALSLGYTPPEIEAAFARTLRRWARPAPKSK